MWHDYETPTTAVIDGVTQPILSDFRVILDILAVYSDPDLLPGEQTAAALAIFYPNIDTITDFGEAVRLLFLFIGGNKADQDVANAPRLMDWAQDLAVIIPPVNRVLGVEVRALPYLHWWTFLAAFMEIGECTFNTFVGIRHKKATGKKLESWEHRLYRQNKERIDLKKKVDTKTQELLDSVMEK